MSCNDLHRYFCMVDTRDSMPGRRVVINIQTKVNVPQAIADGTCRDPDDPEQVARVSKQVADYIDIVYIWNEINNMVVKIHVESGDVEQHINDQTTMYPFPSNKVSLRENVLSREPGIKDKLFQCVNTMDVCVDTLLGGAKIARLKAIVTNVDSRPDYYKYEINTFTNLVNFNMFPFTINTGSRRCEVDIKTTRDWSKYTGALISESDDNIIDCIDQIKD